MTDQVFKARFTRDAQGQWLIAVDSMEAANRTMDVERKGRGPVRMRTGALVGEHPKWTGWYTYERLSKAPTSGRQGKNQDGTEDQGGGQQQQQHAPDGTYVTHPELDAAVAALRGEMAGSQPIQVNGAPGTEPKKLAGKHHKALADVIANVAAGIHTYLVGPAGTGKTHLCLQVAEALGRELDICGAMLTKHEVIGYCDASGQYVGTAMRNAFEHGHLINWDEVDASSPAALVAVNAMLSNDQYTFPDKNVKRHPDFCVIACGNTFGTGADREYVGRMQLDAATLDRFAFIEVDYDEGLERDLGRAHYTAHHADGEECALVEADAWIAEVQASRAAVQEKKIRHVVSPRATINGCKLLARGVKLAKVREMVLYKGAAPDTVLVLKQSVQA